MKRTWRNIGDCRFYDLTFQLLPDFCHRKANANVLAVDERQSLKTLDREFKTATRSLDQLKERVNAFEEQKDKLDKDTDEVQQKADSVSNTVR